MEKIKTLRMRAVIAMVMAAVLILALTTSATAGKNDNTLAAVSVVVLETSGDVEIKNQSGNPIPVFENMQLHSGYEVKTDIRSYAWMALDDSKEAGLDSVSNMAVQKQGKQLVLMLDQGNMFFDVSKKLGSDETMNIRTSTMVMGITGTFGIISAKNNMTTEIMVLDGSTDMNAVNPISGESRQLKVTAGDYVTVNLTEDGGVEVEVTPIEPEDIQGFVLEYLADEPDTLERIEESLGEDLSEAIKNKDMRLESDEQSKEEALEKIVPEFREEKVNEENADSTVVPYFKDGETEPEETPVPHTHTWTYVSAGADNHTKKCSGCGESSTEAHTLSTVSNGDDTHTVSCSVCEYSSTSAHTIGEFTSSGESVHTAACSECGYSINAGHEFGPYTSAGDTDHTAVCGVCGEQSSKAHTLSYTTDGETTHTAECSECGYSSSEAHSFGSYTSNEDGEHSMTCSACGQTATEAHDISVTSVNASNHIESCSKCDYSLTTEHVLDLGDPVDSSVHKIVCAYCDYETTQSHELVPTTNDNTETTHEVMCECGYKSTAPHSMQLTSISDTHHAPVCTACEYVLTESTGEHFFSYSQKTTSEHRKYCTCGYESTESHVYGEQYCTKCNYDVFNTPAPVIP